MLPRIFRHAAVLLSGFLAVAAIAGERGALFPPSPFPSVAPSSLERAILSALPKISEFEEVRNLAEARGLRAWLLGGTAATVAHYAKWEILRARGEGPAFLREVDHRLGEIFLPTQDIDLVVDGGPDDTLFLRDALSARFPYVKWEVRALKTKVGDKEALLGASFLNQHNDSYSLGLIELTSHGDEPRIRDLNAWDSERSRFLEDVAAGRISYLFSEKHAQSHRVFDGKNPPILSVVRLLTKAFQFHVGASSQDMTRIREIVAQFGPQEIWTEYVHYWFQAHGPKLVQNAMDVAHAWNTMERIGLRQKLLALPDHPAATSEGESRKSLQWWMAKEPLRDASDRKRLGLPREAMKGSATAGEIGLTVVTHNTRDFQTWQAIRRNVGGVPNFFSSRQGHDGYGEVASLGDGVYTSRGNVSEARAGYPVRLEVLPHAREGVDFSRFKGVPQTILWLTRDKLRVLPEPLKLGESEAVSYLLDLKTEDELAVRRRVKSGLERDVPSRDFIKRMDRAILTAARDPRRFRLVQEEFILWAWYRAHGNWLGVLRTLASQARFGGAEPLLRTVLSQEFAIEHREWPVFVDHIAEGLAEAIDEAHRAFAEVILANPLVLKRREYDAHWLRWAKLMEEHQRKENIVFRVLAKPEAMGHPHWITMARRAAYRPMSLAVLFGNLLREPGFRDAPAVRKVLPLWLGRAMQGHAALVHWNDLVPLMGHPAVADDPRLERWVDEAIRAGVVELVREEVLSKPHVKKHPKYREWMRRTRSCDGRLTG